MNDVNISQCVSHTVCANCMRNELRAQFAQTADKTIRTQFVQTAHGLCFVCQLHKLCMKHNPYTVCAKCVQNAFRMQFVQTAYKTGKTQSKTEFKLTIVFSDIYFTDSTDYSFTGTSTSLLTVTDIQLGSHIVFHLPLDRCFFGHWQVSLALFHVA
jgi:hypothetical protein